MSLFNSGEIADLKQQNKFLMDELVSLKAELSKTNLNLEKKPDKLEKDAYERLADLEVKMAKLWSMLLEVDKFGKEKLSKYGKRFGGQSKHLI